MTGRLSNPARLRDGLAGLRKLLNDSDATAGEALAELLSLAQGTPLAAPLRKIQAATEAYDFDAALALLGDAEELIKAVE